MSRRIQISEESFGLLEHMKPLSLDNIILMFAKTYIGIAESLSGDLVLPITEEVHSKIQHLTLTKKEYESLRTKYNKEAIESVLLDMKNYSGLKKYKSAYLTANKWLSRRGKEALIGSTGAIEFGSPEWEALNG